MQGKVQYPAAAEYGAAPGTLRQKALASAEGATITVVPESMAMLKGLLPYNFPLMLGCPAISWRRSTSLLWKEARAKTLNSD